MPKKPETINKRLWSKAGLARIPLAGTFELLPMCNLQCKMCYVRKSKAEVDALGGLPSAAEWLDWAGQARALGLVYPLLTGGEPLLHPDFQEILAGIKEMGMLVSINSNATLIDAPMAKWLGSHKPTRINITLYGASEQSYQNLCGDGSAFARVHRAVELLKQYEVPFKFNASITPENVGDLEALIAYAKRVEAPIQVATYMFPPLRRDAALVGQNDRLSPEQAALARVKADWLQGDPNWFRGQAWRFSHFVPVTEEMLARQTAAEPRGMTCRAGRCSFWIDWQGNIGNCGMYTSAKTPLRGSNVADAWRQVTEQTEQIRYSPVCTNCPNFPLCHPCIAMVHNECGAFDGRPEYLCRMNAASARYYAEYAKQLPPADGAAEAISLTPDFPCELDP